MARRIRRPTWGKSLLKSLQSLTRATLKSSARVAATSSRKAVRKATRQVVKQTVAPRVRPLAKPTLKAVARPPKARRTTAAATPGWSDGVAVAAGTARRYRLYRPPGAARSARLPLLVMLHGCHQNAEQLERSARLQRLALQQGFCVLYPEQDRYANPQGCWNWYLTRSGRAYGEAAAILAQIDQLCARRLVDPARISVAGLSAGASMAALLGARYPQRFRAVAMHSGIGPGAAHSSASAIGAMQGRRQPSLPAAVGGAPPLPPLLVIQGSGDAIVRAGNGRAAAQAWADQAGARTAATRTVQRGQRYPMRVTDFKLGTRTIARLCEVQGLGHAWSGGAVGQPFSDPKGPDASRLICAFAARQFQLAAPASD